MVPFKEIFRLLAALSIIAGVICYILGVPQLADIMVKSGLVVLLLTSALGSIRIPKNSMGTPLEKGLPPEHLRMVLKDR